MSLTQQRQIRHISRSTMLKLDNMMNVAPIMRRVATIEHTPPTITNHHGKTLQRCRQATRAAKVHYHLARPAHRPVQVASGRQLGASARSGCSRRHATSALWVNDAFRSAPSSGVRTARTPTLSATTTAFVCSRARQTDDPVARTNAAAVSRPRVPKPVINTTKPDHTSAPRIPAIIHPTKEIVKHMFDTLVELDRATRTLRPVP